MADGSRHSLGYIAEVTYGTTPATPVFQLARNTSVSLAVNKDALMSEEIRSDRQRFDMRQGAYKVTGEVGVELSYGAYDDWLEAMFGGAWTGNVLKAGTTRRSFTFERNFSDITDDPYFRYTGVEIDKLSLTIGSNAIVKGSFSVLGSAGVMDTAIITGATYTSPLTNHVFDGFTGTVKEGGTSSAVITEVQLTIENGLSPRYVVGSKYTLRPGIGFFNVSGTATMWFEDSTKVAKFLNETESSIDITMTDAAAHGLEINIPRIKYTGAPPDVKGIGPITLAMPFQALLDTATTNSNIVLTRTP